MSSRDAQPPAIPDHELLRRIGDGSYGEVWLARNATGTLRAVKIVHRSSFKDERPYEREFAGLKNFEPVSRAHPGLVDILQIGRNDDTGYFYYVMELADDAASPRERDGRSKMENGSQAQPATGHPPSSILNHQSYVPLTLESRIRANGRIPVKDCVTIGLALAEALEHLHQAGLVHRDIKPSNIIFVDGEPKLADVGLVARVESARSFVGTEGFVPPEGPGTPRADIFSLGKCLYEMAMGKDRQAFPSPPTLLDEIPDRKELLELNEVITKACDPEPTRRYRSGTDVRADLALLDAGRSVRDERTRRRRWRQVGLVTLALAVIAGVWLAARTIARAPTDPRITPSVTHTFAVRDFELPAGFSPANMPFGEFMSDGEPAIFSDSTSGGIVVQSLRGQSLVNSVLEPRRHFSIGLLADVDGDRRAEMFCTWRIGANLGLGILNQNAYAIRAFERAGAATQPLKDGECDPWWRVLAFLPATNQLPSRVIVCGGHECKDYPRYLLCLNATNGAELWQYPMASGVDCLVQTDLDGDGLTDLLFSTGAPDNGVVLPDGRDDSHADLIALRHDGGLLWQRRLGGRFGLSPIRLGVVDGAPCIFVMKWRDFYICAASQWKDKGETRLLRLDYQGHILNEWTTTNMHRGFVVAALDPRKPPEVFSGDADGYLNVFDAHLNTPRRILITPRNDRTNCWVQLTVAAVEDLDGCGRKELVLISQDFEYLGGNNLGKLEGRRNDTRTLNNQIVVLDHGLKGPATYAISPRHDGNGAPFVQVVTNMQANCPEIGVLEQRAHFLRLRRR